MIDVEVLNLQDKKMTERVITIPEKTGPEIDAPNRRDGKWKTKSFACLYAFSSPCDLVHHFPGPVFSRSCFFSLQGLNPLAHLNDPLALINFNPLGGSGRCNPLAHITSLSVNGLLRIITRPLSTTMHCMCTVIWASFGYKDKF